MEKQRIKAVLCEVYLILSGIFLRKALQLHDYTESPMHKAEPVPFTVVPGGNGDKGGGSDNTVH